MTSPLYGIRITLVYWVTVDGGPDLVGTREEMERKASEWRAKLYPDQVRTITYEVALYDGYDPADGAI